MILEYVFEQVIALIVLLFLWSILATLQHAMHLLRRYPQEAMCMPVWMVYHFIWKRTLKTI